MERRLNRRELIGGAAVAAGGILVVRELTRPGDGEATASRGKVVIVGGGLAGLTAAYELERAGFSHSARRGPRSARRSRPHDPRLHRRPARRVRRRGDRHQTREHPAALPALRPPARERLQRLREADRDDLPRRPQLPRLPVPHRLRPSARSTASGARSTACPSPSTVTTRLPTAAPARTATRSPTCSTGCGSAAAPAG